MNILLVVDDYLPHSKKIASIMMHDLAKEFVSKGHIVKVITPKYKLKSKYEKKLIDDVEVLFFRSGKIKNVNYFVRLKNEILLSFKAWFFLKKEISNFKIDITVFYSPSIFWGSLIKRIKLKHKSYCFMILRDIFPQWAIDNGLIKEKSFITMFFKKIEDINYINADQIAVQSQGNLDWFLKKNNSYISKFSVLYNWINPPLIKKNTWFRDKYNLRDKVIYFYGGNIGRAQDISTLLRLAKELENNNEAFFVFLGEGDEVPLVTDAISTGSAKNILYLPYVENQKYLEILSEVDVGLISLSKEHVTHNFPGKILNYMSLMKPILGIVNKGNDIKNVIVGNDAGFIIDDGDIDTLLYSAKKLLDKERRYKFGMNASNLVKKQFSTEMAYNEIIKSYKNKIRG